MNRDDHDNNLAEGNPSHAATQPRNRKLSTRTPKTNRRLNPHPTGRAMRLDNSKKRSRAPTFSRRDAF
jgi:hypothetical protein